MTAHLSAGQLEAYLTGTSRPSDLLRADAHLADCEACRQRLASSERVLAGVAALRESFRADVTPEHPSQDQIAAYVDGGPDEIDREPVDAHLETCRTCTEDVEDLQNVKLSIPAVVPFQRRRRTWYAAGGLAAAAALAGILVWSGRNAQPQPDIDAGASRASETIASPGNSASPPIILSLNDGGGNVTLDAAGVLAGIPALAPDDRDIIVAALRTGRVEIPLAIAELRGRTGILLGTPAGAGFQTIRPVATAVESAQPVFEWTALAGATSYIVSVFDTNLDKMAESEPLTALQWTPSQPLTRGRVYTWQVRARTAAEDIVSPAPPTPESRFRVIAETEADRVTTMRSTYGGSPLALGVLLARAGLLDAAERSLERVLAANPSSREAQELLASVRNGLGR